MNFWTKKKWQKRAKFGIVLVNSKFTGKIFKQLGFF